MSVTPPISSFFGLDPRFIGGPAASSSLINPLLFGSSFQMVPINHGGFSSGIPPIFGGRGFTGFPTIPFDIFSQPSVLMSPFTGGGAFGNGFGTQPFGSNQFGQNFTFNPQPMNILSLGGGLSQFAPQQQFSQQQQFGFPQQQFSQQQFGFPQQQFGFPQQQFSQQQFGFPQQQFSQQQQFGFPQQQFGFPQQQFSQQQFASPFGFGGFF